MKRPPRFMQDVVIGMAILVLILALWRLHSRPEFFGGLGAWARSNVFGAATLSLISGPGQDEGEGQPLPPLSASAPATNQPGLPGTNPPAAASGLASRSSNGPPSA